MFMGCTVYVLMLRLKNIYIYIHIFYLYSSQNGLLSSSFYEAPTSLKRFALIFERCSFADVIYSLSSISN